MIENNSGDARCNFCDGPMPCWCKLPSKEELDRMHKEDAYARDKVDYYERD